MKNKKVIVTGSSGFIGSNLVTELSQKGYQVVGIDIENPNPSRCNQSDFEFQKVDIRDIESLEKVFSGAFGIFHCAAIPRVPYSIENPLDTNQTNVTGTLNVLEVARNSGVKRVVFSSSSSVYGDQEKLPLTEDMETMPKSPYGLHKYIGERYCVLYSQIYDLQTVSLRYFNVYGPGQSAEGAYALLIAKFLKLKDENKPLTITGDGEQTRDFTHVSDVVCANIKAMESDKVGMGEAVNIGAGNNVSVNKIAEMIGGEIEYTEARLEPKDTRASNQKARELLDWVPKVSVEEGIKDLFDRENRYIL